MNEKMKWKKERESEKKNKIELYKQQKNHKNYMILYYDISKANKNAMEKIKIKRA